MESTIHHANVKLHICGYIWGKFTERRQCIHKSSHTTYLQVNKHGIIYIKYRYECISMRTIFGGTDHGVYCDFQEVFTFLAGW